MKKIIFKKILFWTLHLIILLFTIGIVSAIPIDAQHYWDFGEGVDTNAEDNWGAEDGTLNDGTIWSGSYPTYNITDDGASYSVYFDGINDDITMGDIDSTVDMTWSFWLKAVVDNNNGKFLIAKHSASYDYAFYVEDHDNIRVYGSSGSGLLDFTLNTGNWEYITIVKTGNNWEGYQNAESVGSISVSTVNNDADMTIGAQKIGDTGFTFNGNIDELKIFNRSLNLNEVHLIYNYGDIDAIAPVIDFDLKAIDTNGSIISNFSVNINGTNFTTTNGIIISNYSIGESLINLYYYNARNNDSLVFFNETFNNVKINETFIANLTSYKIPPDMTNFFPDIEKNYLNFFIIFSILALMIIMFIFSFIFNLNNLQNLSAIFVLLVGFLLLFSSWGLLVSLSIVLLGIILIFVPKREE